MIQTTTSIRVRYGETDQMGYVYYGNYAQYYEVGRVELIRYIGLSYKQLEESGIMLPVLNMQSKFLAPGKYDDELSIVTTVQDIPTGFRIKFDYEIYNQMEELIHKGMTELVFFDKQKNKPCRAPDYLIQKMREHDNLE